VSELLKTPLRDWHVAQGAKMAPFAGWDMPIQYAGILAEHNHTRTAASLFDICHMGEFLLKGPGVAEAFGRIGAHDLATLMVRPLGNVTPMVATGTSCPAATLGAPQTMASGAPCPTSTLHKVSASACGCFSQVSTRPTTIS